jgi:hypothetical protein
MALMSLRLSPANRVLGWAVTGDSLAYRKWQQRIDRLRFLIVATDTPWQEINIERLYLRTEAARLFPDKLAMYDMIYESRFQRLWNQFRAHQPPPLTG